MAIEIADLPITNGVLLLFPREIPMQMPAEAKLPQRTRAEFA